MPKSRFNIDAHFHENLERPGSFNVLGGYFLDGDPADFDPTFFGITPVEAMWLDPQQRKMLEVSYECLESAGLSLDVVSGSNTAVFVGSFTSDYQQMSTKDPDFRHNYAATGVDPGIISNRIGNMFNLKGPSFTINTACSSAIYAIHNACHALRARDCDAAIAGGVNLVLTVDQHMNTAKLGILSPTSTCHTFDACADGYGRAEGVGALYLQRLSDAIRNGDPVRAVIRSSAVNTNGKVPDMGITHPSVKGQELVVRKAYERANLDPEKTAYLEMHGTGTPVGDPIEARAVSNAMNDTRCKTKPLLVGAIKASIGHSEAASGIFAVMKAAMMTENATIPGVAGLKSLNPAIKEREWNVKVNVNTTPWPSEFPVRRAGVSSFGYGGTNGHVVLESVDSLNPWYQHGKSKEEASYDNSTTRPLLVSFSAHDKKTLYRNVAAHARVADKFFLADIAHTLNTRRSKLAQRAYTIATEEHAANDFSPSSLKISPAAQAAPKLGFIFTGQGAQWAGMGVEAMQIFPSFRETIQRLDGVLQKLASPPMWKIEEVLSAPAEISPINDAEIAQPACTAIQIAMTDLLGEWNINPTVTVGHSSGEIGAAYAAGLHSAPEAIIAAYFRGLAVKHHAPSGTMLAVGLGAEMVANYITEYENEVVVACENSPESTTLSGTFEAIRAVKSRLDAVGVFARELKTGKAYHSPQMSGVALHYDQALARAYSELDQKHLDWCRTRERMVSSVTGSEILDEKIPMTYWSFNLRNRVLFNTAVATLAKDSEFQGVTTFLEVGPHSALAGPFKQIQTAMKLDSLVYVPTFARGVNSAIQILRTAGDLLVQDYPLNIEAVNAFDELRIPGKKRKRRPHVLVDLPPYQWNYERRFWTEPQPSQEQRSLDFIRHDLLGSKISGLSKRSMVWKNVLRNRDIPWLKDHALGGATIFPAAGHMSMAIEALRQLCEIHALQLSGVTLRDITISTALVIPETDDGIEVQLRLQDTSISNTPQKRYSFAVESRSGDGWTVHCEGSISPILAVDVVARDLLSPVDSSNLTERIPAKRWYDAFHRVGFRYEGAFQPLIQIRTNGKDREAAADVPVATESGVMTGESRYILHPATVDACLQLIIISINKGQYKEMPWGVVPVGVEEARLWFPGTEAGSVGNAVAWTDESDGRYFNTHTKLRTETGQLVLDIKSLKCVAYEAAVPQQNAAEAIRQPYSQVLWKPDIYTMTAAQVVTTYPEASSECGFIGLMVDLLNHKKVVRNILVLGIPPVDLLEAVTGTMGSATSITVTEHNSEILENFKSTSSIKNVSTLVLPVCPDDWTSSANGQFDLVIALSTKAGSYVAAEFLPGIRGLVSDDGHFILSTGKVPAPNYEGSLQSSAFGPAMLRFDLPESSVIVSAANTKQTEQQKISHSIEIFGAKNAEMEELARHLSSQGCQANVARFANFRVSTAETCIIYDFDGSLLSSLDAYTFDSLKAILCSGKSIIWLSRGVNEGRSISGGMSQGFLRAIRSENATARIMLIDADLSEPIEVIGRFMLEKMNAILAKDSGAETEFWLKVGIPHVVRVVANDKLNESSDDNVRPAEDKLLPAESSLEGAIIDGSLVFEPVAESPLDAQDVELQVFHSELSKKDIQTRGQAPRVVAGKIVKVGEHVSADLLGKNCTAFSASYATTVRVPESHCIVEPFIEAENLTATLPSLCKVVNALVMAAKVQPNDHVLFLPAPNSLVRAAFKYGEHFGYRLTVIVSSEEEKTSLLNKEKISGGSILSSTDLIGIQRLLASPTDAPSVVIANDFTALSQEVWRLTPALARFVLCDTMVEVAPDALPFMRGATFISTGINTLYKRDQSALTRLLSLSIRLAVENPELVVKDASTVDIGALKDTAAVSEQIADGAIATLAYSYGLSNILVSRGCEYSRRNAKSVKLRRSTKRIRFSSDAAYLLVGCLGGLGRSLCKFMSDRGCKNFAFLSRSGVDKPEAAAVVASLEKAGANVQVIRGDASQADDVQRAVGQVKSRRPIRGVVHAAMVLKVSSFHMQQYAELMQRRMVCTIA